MTTAVFSFEHAANSSKKKIIVVLKALGVKNISVEEKEHSSELTQCPSQFLLPIQQFHLSLQRGNGLFLRLDCLLQCRDQLFGN